MRTCTKTVRRGFLALLLVLFSVCTAAKAAPVVSFSAPASDTTLKGKLGPDSPSCEVDGTSIAKVVFSVEGRQLNTENIAPWQCIWDTTTTTDGPHVLKAVAYDSAGATSSTQVSIKVDNVPDAPPPPSGCQATLTPTSGIPFCPDSPVNTLIGVPYSDPNEIAILSKINTGTHTASLYEYGTRVYSSSSGVQRTIHCTQTGWGTCPLEGKTIALNSVWKPSSGTDHAMVPLDFSTRKVYDFWRVAVNADNTVHINADGSINVAWGDLTSIDGTGQAKQATGSGLSHMYGMVRVREAQRATSLGGCSTETNCPLIDAIPHGLHFATSANCTTYRYPALKSDGHLTSACIPEGTRVYLDVSANCGFDAARPIEEAVCFALKRYGAFDTDSGGGAFSLGFEGPTAGIAGGSGSDPYPAGGLKWDYYDMSHIPWAKLKVAGYSP